jgi:hypothetical protein
MIMNTYKQYKINTTNYKLIILRLRGCSPMVGHLPSMHKALGLVLSTKNI